MFKLIVAILCLTTVEALAVEQQKLVFKIDDGTGKIEIHEVSIANNRSEYVTDLGEKIISIDLRNIQSELPLSIEQRAFTGWAVGEDGPWVDLDGTEQSSPWQKIVTDNSFDLKIPESEIVEAGTFSSELYAIAYKNLEKSSDKDRWLPVLKRCKGNPDGSPCYSYHSADEFKFTYPDKSEITFRINYPGGC